MTDCHSAAITLQSITDQPPQPQYEEYPVWIADSKKTKPLQENNVMRNRSSVFCTVNAVMLTVIGASLYDINKDIKARDLKERPLEQLIPELCHEFLPLFKTVLPYRLPPHLAGIDY